MGNNELIKNIDNLNMNYLNYENNSHSDDKKENFENKEARLIALKSEGENILNEKEVL